MCELELLRLRLNRRCHAGDPQICRALRRGGVFENAKHKPRVCGLSSFRPTKNREHYEAPNRVSTRKRIMPHSQHLPK